MTYTLCRLKKKKKDADKIHSKLYNLTLRAYKWQFKVPKRLSIQNVQTESRA